MEVRTDLRLGCRRDAVQHHGHHDAARRGVQQQAPGNGVGVAFPGGDKNKNPGQAPVIIGYSDLMTTGTRPRSDYNQWQMTQKCWGSTSEFLDGPPWADGIHTVDLGDGPALDILIKGKPHEAGSVIPVFFNGAVGSRETKAGPFFSGSGIAAKAGVGFIAISDPSLNLDESLGLAWYAGNKFSNVQDQITEILAGIAEHSGREMLFVGGSGGGFASLYYGGRLSTVASAIVWNPQTEIRKYNQTFVDNYMRHAWGDEVCTTQTSVVGSLPKRLIYMQNASDWHVTGHTQPYLEAGGFEHRGSGIFGAGDDRIVCIASYGEGHAPLPEAPLLTAIKLMMEPARTASRVVEGIASRYSAGRVTPEWSHPHLTTVGATEVLNIGN